MSDKFDGYFSLWHTYGWVTLVRLTSVGLRRVGTTLVGKTQGWNESEFWKILPPVELGDGMLPPAGLGESMVSLSGLGDLKR